MKHNLLQREAGLDSYFDVLSREIKVPNTTPVPTEAKILQSNQLSEWNLVIAELSGNCDLQLKIVLKQQNSEYTYKQPLNRGGSWSLQGWGAVTVFATAINAGTATVSVSLQPETSINPYVMNQGNTTFQNAPVIGTFYDIESTSDITPAGYAPPFTRFLDLLPVTDGKYRYVDSTGAVIWASGTLSRLDPLFRNIRVFPWYKLQLAGTAVNQAFGVLWHN
jgi:hypothetical protein